MKKNKNAVLICAYNEEKYINGVVNNCLKYIDNVMVVNDGSTDNTLAELTKTDAQIITYSKNQGKGYALRKGFSEAMHKDYTHLILLDGDGQHDPKEIPKFIEELNLGADLVIGCRRKRGSNMPKRRRFSNATTSFLISLKGRKWIKDTQSGYRAIKLSFLRKMKLKSISYELESEILIKMMKQKAKITCIPIETIYGDEVSSIRPLKEMRNFVRVMLKRWN